MRLILRNRLLFYTIAVFSCIFFAAGPVLAVQDKAFYKSEVQSAVNQCRNLIKGVDRQDELWKKKPRFYQRNK